ncbi:DNA adenine methylase [Crocosphaera sp.]|uniref:DNA adenine methylase n=1 Tax=Crocosphaera sp. TaxID=2729996 RepID=UPI0026312650|nr:DNA adenine methylase [Crocosphaera sp.]MDJ0580191.1 DNA adenine methylase [Crocosphaera sp.]
MSKNKVRKLSNSPFRYPGGKFYARKLILPCIPKHDKYCEPFVGGGSIFFAKPNTKVNILNDKDSELINTYIQIRDNVEDLINLLDGIPASKELHKYYKLDYSPSNDLERAMRWFYLNRTSYSGIMKQANCYWGYGDKYSMRPENWPKHLRTTSGRLKLVKFLSLDFQEVIEYLEEDFFLFIDPPYFGADQDKFYSCSFNLEDHYRLSEVLEKNSSKFKFLITYDNVPEIREMYNWCTSIQDNEWNYTINRTDDQKNKKKLSDGYKSNRYKGKEIFITNYDINNVSGVEPFVFIKQLSLF